MKIISICAKIKNISICGDFNKYALKLAENDNQKRFLQNLAHFHKRFFQILRKYYSRGTFTQGVEEMTTQQINTILTNDINYTDGQKLYDENCKKILSNKMILAWIMKECIWEFKDIEVADIADFYIEGQPDIGNIKVFGGEKIRGLPTEMINDNDGKIFYDIRYRTIAPTDNEETTELIINLEAQYQYHVGYPLIKRGSFYASQMLTNQYGTEFAKVDYNKLKKVYSIWICHAVPKKLANSINCYEAVERKITGCLEEERQNYDLTSVVMIYLGDSSDQSASPVLNLLNRLLCENLSAEEKLEMLEVEYGIPRTKKMEEEMVHMCNLSQGVLQRGFDRGIVQGIDIGKIEGKTEGKLESRIEIAKKMLADKLPLKTISEYTELPIETIEKL